jgi:hypothetical protein
VGCQVVIIKIGVILLFIAAMSSEVLAPHVINLLS